MKREYNKPTIEIEKITIDDIITTSGDLNTKNIKDLFPDLDPENQ